MKKGKRVAEAVSSALLAVLLLMTAVTPALAVKKGELDSLIARANELREQRAALAEQISGYDNDIAVTLEKKALLDGEIAVIEEEVANLEAQISLYREQIAETADELDRARAREEEKYAQFCQRVRAMEEQGRMNYWTILFHATSFTDFLTRLDFVSEIMAADQRVVDELRAVQEEIAAKQAELEAGKQELEEAGAECLAKKAELDTRRDAANELIAGLQGDRAAAEAGMEKLSAEAEEIQAEILRLSEELAREEDEAAAYRQWRNRLSEETDGLISSGASGGYIWPVDSRRITSTFGGRASPGGIGSTNHKGVDIGGVGYGTAIHAAKAGVVLLSQYSSSYGNYVVISHGGGNTTLYAHMSSRLVSAGQSVGQGDLIGLTGSTGNSTGPHLHFEITENGSRINPLVYLSGYSLNG